MAYGQEVPLQSDTELRTPSGATLTVAKGWYVGQDKDALLLQEPDKELLVAIVENKATNADGAIQSAWKVVQPGFSRKVEQSIALPARDGWEEVVQTVYQTTTQESRVVIAAARRKADRWYVTVVDGTKAALDRRGAQLMTTVNSLKPQGLEAESFKGRTAHTLDADRLKVFERFVEEARTMATVPGAAVALVQGGKVVFQKGFGVREHGRVEPVTPNTLFMIGSTTKSLTTLMMARLVDEGRMSWDCPVTRLLPSFALGDADITRQLTLANTVCACSGLPRQDMEFLFEYGSVTPEMRIRSMKTMKPTTGFGETFQYSNTMVAAGGFAAAHVLYPREDLGTAYNAVMKTRVLEPLGMKSTTFDFTAVRSMEHATPHGETLAAEYLPLPLSDEEAVIPVRPAGAAWSTVPDMARYILTELAKGKTPEGKQVVTELNLLKRREPQVKITNEMSYGLGLFVEDDHGVRVVHHGGNTMGFTSDMFFLPDHGIGAVVLTNASGANAFRKAVRRKVLEMVFDGREEARHNLEFSVRHNKERAVKELEKVDLTPDAGWLSSLVGSYRNDALGTVQIRVDGTRGILDAGEWKSTLGRKLEADGTVKIILTGANLAGLEMVCDQAGGRNVLTLETAQQKYVFKPLR